MDRDTASLPLDTHMSEGNINLRVQISGQVVQNQEAIDVFMWVSIPTSDVQTWQESTLKYLPKTTSSETRQSDKHVLSILGLEVMFGCQETSSVMT